MRSHICGLRGAAATVALGATLAAATAGLAHGRAITGNTIFERAALRDGGRAIRIGGPIACDRLQHVKIVVRITQRETAAYGVGTFTGACKPGSGGRWVATVRATGRERFRAGPAEAAALAITRKKGRRTDAHQWLKQLELVKP